MSQSENPSKENAQERRNANPSLQKAQELVDRARHLEEERTRREQRDARRSAAETIKHIQACILEAKTYHSAKEIWRRASALAHDSGLVPNIFVSGGVALGEYTEALSEKRTPPCVTEALLQRLTPTEAGRTFSALTNALHDFEEKSAKSTKSFPTESGRTTPAIYFGRDSDDGLFSYQPRGTLYKEHLVELDLLKMIVTEALHVQEWASVRDILLKLGLYIKISKRTPGSPNNAMFYPEDDLRMNIRGLVRRVLENTSAPQEGAVFRLGSFELCVGSNGRPTIARGDGTDVQEQDNVDVWGRHSSLRMRFSMEEDEHAGVGQLDDRKTNPTVEEMVDLATKYVRSHVPVDKHLEVVEGVYRELGAKVPIDSQDDSLRAGRFRRRAGRQRRGEEISQDVADPLVAIQHFRDSYYTMNQPTVKKLQKMLTKMEGHHFPEEQQMRDFAGAVNECLDRLGLQLVSPKGDGARLSVGVDKGKYVTFRYKVSGKSSQGGSKTVPTLTITKK